MKNSNYVIVSFLALFLLLFNGCKSKEKQSQVAKKPVAKKETKTQPVQAGKATSKDGNELEQKLGVGKKQIHDNKLYAFVDEWYGTPYKYGGCQKSGVDCSCFTNLLYETVYGKKIARSASDMFIACDKLSIDDAKQGDLLFFKIGGNSITHVGVFLKNKLFVHSSTSKGVMVNSVEEAYYKKYFFCAGKVKGS